ncbi:MAG: GAF domain-containing protein, partial [Bacteroidota bacterium]
PSRLLNQYQKDAQRVLPHYFEMYKTDGVEYNIYMGESMLHGQDFDEKYIENIRLWQLMTMIAITRKVHEIQPDLELPLKTAELILAFSNKIAIRFKTEEKQFDVDGAYNVRYEVIKKRIDKSKIKGTNERLTQAGKIAIVFTQEKERLEYLQFFEYLKAQKMIEEEVEELLIDELQGVSGLRALRVKVIV